MNMTVYAVVDRNSGEFVQIFTENWQAFGFVREAAKVNLFVLKFRLLDACEAY